MKLNTVRTTEPQAAQRMERAGDFDLTGMCDWKRDRKCSTWRMRRRFAAVLCPACQTRGAKTGNELSTRREIWELSLAGSILGCEGMDPFFPCL